MMCDSCDSAIRLSFSRVGPSLMIANSGLPSVRRHAGKPVRWRTDSGSDRVHHSRCQMSQQFGRRQQLAAASAAGAAAARSAAARAAGGAAARAAGGAAARAARSGAARSRAAVAGASAAAAAMTTAATTAGFSFRRHSEHNSRQGGQRKQLTHHDVTPDWTRRSLSSPGRWSEPHKYSHAGWPRVRRMTGNTIPMAASDKRCDIAHPACCQTPQFANSTKIF